MKNLNIRKIICIQAAVVFLIPIYLISWYLGYRPDFWFHCTVLTAYIFQRILENKSRKEMDERTEAVLDKTNAFCFDLSVAIIALSSAWMIIMEKTAATLGIILAISVFLLYVVRAILFLYWDKNGMF
ncbi:MAG: hypothetical protein IKM61_06515 [Eubacteriaceae bacterium]|nr:hypothetical protein [Eubacteriaceae bacterium]